MQSSFGVVLWVVIGVGVVVAVACLLLSRRTWEEIGKRGLTVEPARSRPSDRDEEIRQMLEARNARRARRGEAPVDVEAELSRLTATLDPSLIEEVRELVIARNHRRLRRGEEPLDVDTEVARELARLGGV